METPALSSRCDVEHGAPDDYRHRFEEECRLLGEQSAAARLRLDEKGPEAYQMAFVAYRGPRRFPPYFERKWLSLRLNAVKRGMLVDRTVTPAFLERITDGRCPVTLQRFSTDGRSTHNPSVDRLVNDLTYCAGNVCLLSMRANRAKADLSFEQVAELAQTGKKQAGLEPVEWMRLASLMYGAWSRARRKADPYLMPLAALPGRGMFMSTSQVVQLLLTRHYSPSGAVEAANRLWLGLTEQAGCERSVFLGLRSGLVEALAQESFPGNAWLREDVFEAFVAWYMACRAAVVPTVEGVLQRHQERVADPVASLEWWAIPRRTR